MTDVSRDALQSARLYLLSGPTSDARLDAALRGGVDMLQFAHPRDAGDNEIVTIGRRFKTIAAKHGVPMLLNSRPDLVAACDADGVHLNSDGGAVTDARRILGPEPLVGLWTRSEEQVDGAAALAVDYISVGPINVTPTLADVPATGTELAAYAAAHSAVPVFAIGGIDATSVQPIFDVGLTRVAVLRLVVEAADPEQAVASLKAALG